MSVSRGSTDLGTVTYQKTALYLIRLLVCVVLLTYVLTRYDVTSVFLHLRNAQLYELAAGLLTLYVGILMSSLRWKSILQGYGRQNSLLRLFRLNIEANFLNLFFPGFVAGDVSRIFRTPKNGRPSLEDVAGVFMDRFFGFAIFCLYVSCIAFFGGYAALDPTWHYMIYLMLALAITCLLLILRIRLVDRLLRFLPKSFNQRLEKIVEKMQITVRTLVSHPTTIWQSACLSLLFILSMVNAAYFISRSIDLPIPFRVLLAYVPLTAFINNLPISIAGLGVRENIYVFFFSALGFVPEHILAFGLTISGLNLFLRLSGGFLLLVRLPHLNLRARFSGNMSFKELNALKPGERNF